MKALTPKRFAFTLVLLLLICLGALSVSPFIGPTRIDPGKAFDFSVPAEQNQDRSIFFLYRLPRILLAALVGGCLAVSGVAFQAILKNDLATPYTLGISGGGSLGAVLVIRFGLDFSLFGISSLPLFAFAGSLLAVLLVFSIARVKEGVHTVTLLLVGVMANFFFSAVTLLVNYLSDISQSYRIVRWLMGGLDVMQYSTILKVLPFMICGVVILTALSRRLNLISLGEDTATSLGVDLARTVKITFVAASLATGAAVAVSGPIGFVGLLIPHAMRILVGPDHRLLMPASLLGGASFLALCDTAARTVFAPVELPVGVITSLTGVPFFIWLIGRGRYHGVAR